MFPFHYPPCVWMGFQESRRRSEAEGTGDSAEMTPIGSPPNNTDTDGEFHDTYRAFALLKELGLKVTEDSLALMPIVFSFLKHDAHVVVRQSIATGASLFRAVWEEMALQLHKSGKVERWLEEMWDWMVKFKDAICSILISEPSPVGTKMLAVKFLEIYFLLITSDAYSEKLPCAEGTGGMFNVSCFVEEHPILNLALLASEANKALAILFDLLQLASNLRGSLTIVIINCLAAVARNRPLHYNRILSVLLDFDHDLETLKEGHAASIRFSLRISLLGFLKCNHPLIIESRDKLLMALRAMNPGEATEQVIRRLEKISKNAEHISQDGRISKDDLPSSQVSPCGGVVLKKPVVQAKYYPAVVDAMPTKITQFAMDVMSGPPSETDSYFVQDGDDHDDDDVIGFSLRTSLMDGNLSEVEKMMTVIGALLAEGERGTESLDALISNIHADLMADMVIENMKQLSNNSQAFSSNSSAQVGSAAFATVPVQYSALSTQVALNLANASNTIDNSGGSRATASPPLTG